MCAGWTLSTSCVSLSPHRGSPPPAGGDGAQAHPSPARLSDLSPILRSPPETPGVLHTVLASGCQLRCRASHLLGQAAPTHPTVSFAQRLLQLTDPLYPRQLTVWSEGSPSPQSVSSGHRFICAASLEVLEAEQHPDVVPCACALPDTMLWSGTTCPPSQLPETLLSPLTGLRVSFRGLPTPAMPWSYLSLHRRLLWASPPVSATRSMGSSEGRACLSLCIPSPAQGVPWSRCSARS